MDDTEWERGLAGLRCFVDARGSARVASRAVSAGVLLGRWVAACREEYWAGQLTVERVRILERLPDWDWSGAAQRRWERCLAALVRYVEQHGSANPPLSATVGKLSVGNWVRIQRASHAAGTLPLALEIRLERLKGWTWSPDENRWEAGLRSLRSYVARHGSADVPPNTFEDGYPLGHWVQRCREDRRSSSLTSAQIDTLEGLAGWRWRTAQEQWEKGMSALRAYVATSGSAQLAQKAVVDGFPLGMWVHHQRRQYRAGDLPAERAVELEQLPGWSWGVAGASWERGLAMLSRYQETHGDVRPGFGVIFDGFRLGEWVSQQRRRYRRGRLPGRRIEQLEAMPGWTWTPGR